MPINVQCPYCLKTISARADLAGRKVDCPNCMTQLDVPTEIWRPNTKGYPQKVSADEGTPSYYLDICPHCGKVVSAPDAARWEAGNCPQCKKSLGSSLKKDEVTAGLEKAEPQGAPSPSPKQGKPGHPTKPPFVGGVF